MDDLDRLRRRHPRWEIEREAYGMIRCQVPGYLLMAHGVAAAGRGMTEWETQTGVTAPEGAREAAR